MAIFRGLATWFIAIVVGISAVGNLGWSAPSAADDAPPVVAAVPDVAVAPDAAVVPEAAEKSAAAEVPASTESPAANATASPAPSARTQPAGPPNPAFAPPVQAHLVKVRLPIVGTVDTQVKRQIDQIVSKIKVGGEQPYLILEFLGEGGETGAGSEFERSLSLARYLASDRLIGVRSVAFVPKTLVGHAVLPVLACNEIVIAEDAELGEAGRDERFIDATIREGYREIAERRRTIPREVAMGMLDKQLTVYKVATADGTQYILDDELKALQEKSALTSVETISRAGDLAKFTGRDLRLKYGFVSHLAADRKQLASALKLPSGSLQENLAMDGKWRPVRVDVRGPIHSKQITFIERHLRDRMAAGDINFVCVVIDSPGGSATDSWRLAQYLASEEMNRARTIALVPREARGSAGLIALACDQLIVGPNAIVGGEGADQMNARERQALLQSILESGDLLDREASLLQAMVDPRVVMHQYTRQETGEIRYFTDEELALQSAPDNWLRGEALSLSDGIDGDRLLELQLAVASATTVEEVAAFYHLEGPIEVIEPNWAHLFIERLAHPGVAGVLLFVAVFALMFEFSQPGLGLPGFVSAVCFVLYFWSHALHGTAGWLEAILFVAGVASILIELLVIPGGFVFGLGGAVLVISSIILASQTFVIPRNAYQFGQLPSSLGTLGVIGVSSFAALVMVRKYLPDAPVLKRMMLAPPDDEELEDLDQREALAHLHHLVGKRGRTLTPLLPSGKAMFGDDVIGVVTEGQAIAAGTDVVAVADRGNYLLVEAADLRLG